MADLMSQDEIDALFASMNEGGIDEVLAVKDEKESKKRNLMKYDFGRPSKFNKEQLRTLELIFDNYCRLVSSFLNAYLRTPVTFKVKVAEQVIYSDFSSSLADPVILGICNFHPLKGSVVLDISANIGYTIIDRILGGPGVSVKNLRNFSEIEEILLERIITQMLGYMIEPWENVISLKPELDTLETNAYFAQIMSPNEMVALIQMDIKIGNNEGMVNVCIPHLVLDPIMDRLNTTSWFRRKVDENQELYRTDIETNLEKTVVPISAIIGKTRIAVNDFVNIQVGDIIPLDSYINSDLNILVGDLLKFKAKPGVSKGKNAIQITSMVGRRSK